MSAPEYTQTDAFIYNNEIRPFLPSRIFDAHVHLQIPQFHPNLEQFLPITKLPQFREIDMPSIETWWKILFPHSAVTGLVLGMPSKGCDMLGVNKNMAQSIGHSSYPFSILTGPQFSDAQLEQQLMEFKPAGLKPYMCFSVLEKFNDSKITDYLPESHIALADKYRLCITLHVAKPRGMADPGNLKEITRLVKSYPHCNFILAHCGRCFIAPNMEEALKSLPIASNLWIDTSAVCDTAVFLYLFDRYDRSRILFGTDLVTASGFRGTYLRMGMSWDWSCQEIIQCANGQPIRATFAAYENLCALLTAAKFCKLTQADLENLFYYNAAGLFKLKP